MTPEEETTGNTNADRTELRQRILKTELTAETSEKITKLAEKYKQPKPDVVKEFYNVVCEPRFDIYEDDDDRFDEALECFTVEFINKFRKQMPVFFDYNTKEGVKSDEGAEHLYNSITGITIFERVLSRDDSVWEVCIKDTANELEGKLSLTAKQMLSFGSYKTVFFNTFHFPISNIKVKWDEILVELLRNKATIISAPDSDLMDEAKSLLEELCKMPITSTEGEHAEAGRKIFEQSGIYYVTSTRIKEILKGLECKQKRGDIGRALDEMGVKYVGYKNKHLGTGTHACWWFKKDMFEMHRKGKYRSSRSRV